MRCILVYTICHGTSTFVYYLPQLQYKPKPNQNHTMMMKHIFAYFVLKKNCLFIL